MLIGIVGPCKSGKSTLIRGLEKHGYTCRHIAQEHSFAPTMWLRITNPDILIFLDVSYKQTIKRGMPQWSEADYDEEQHRLRHAREHADLYIDTDQSPEAETLNTALDFLRMGDVEKGDQ